MLRKERKERITTSIPLSYWEKAQDLKIQWNDALMVGIRTLANEQGMTQPEEMTRLELQRKYERALKKLNAHIVEKADEAEKLKEEIDKLKRKRGL